MYFPDYYKKVLDNKKNIIDYYLKKYGYNMEEILEKRFDRIKWCFYANPSDLIEYSKYLYMYENMQETLEFLEEAGFDMSSINVDYEDLNITFADKEMQKKLYLFYNYSIHGEGINRLNPNGLWLFRTDEEYLNFRDNMCNAIQRDFLLQRKCKFFKRLNLFPNDASTKEILSSPEFENLNSYYEMLASKAFKHRQKAASKAFEVREYQKNLSKKIDEVKAKYPSLCPEYYKEITELCMFSGNYDGSVEIDLSDKVNYQCNITLVEDGEVKDIIIFLSPLINDFNTLDLNLRHELRHAFTTSAKKTGISTEEIKIGNKIEVYQNEVLIDSKFNDFNEYVTQYEAIQETKESFANGIYIMTPFGMEFPKRLTSKYDEFLPSLEIIYESLPESAKRSQIEDSNASLYDVIDEKDLHKYEKLINSKNDEALRNIKLPTSEKHKVF